MTDEKPDIVWRLRNPWRFERTEELPSWQTMVGVADGLTELFTDAADEIEALRIALRVVEDQK